MFIYKDHIMEGLGCFWSRRIIIHLLDVLLLRCRMSRLIAIRNNRFILECRCFMITLCALLVWIGNDRNVPLIIVLLIFVSYPMIL